MFFNNYIITPFGVIVSYEPKEHTTIKLPLILVEKIDQLIKSSDLGYTSRSDVVKHALRDFFNNNYPQGEKGAEASEKK